MKHSTGATDLDYEYFCAKVVLVFFKLLGLAPLILVRRVLPEKISKKNLPETSPTIQFTYSVLGCFYNVLLIVCLIGISFISIPLVYDVDYPYKTKLTVTIEVIEAICGKTAVVAIWLLFCTKQTTVVKLMNRLMKIDSAIFDLTGCRYVESNRYYFFSLFFANFLLLIAMIVSNHQYFDAPILCWFNNIVPCMIVNWLTIQYVMTIKHIETRFRSLNRALLDNGRSWVVRPIRSLIFESSSMDNHCFPKIIAFRRAHILLYEIARDVAEFYSLPIVLAIAFSCYTIVYNAYYAILPLVLSIEENAILMSVSSVVWMASMLIPIAMLSAGVERINNQMRKTADVVHKLLTRSVSSREDKFELEDFSRELLQRNVTFYAYGLFPLDCTLVQSICSMVGMYLVILVQFQVATSKTDVKSMTQHVTDGKLNTS